MKIKYFNYSQAKAISNDFQHLIGRPYEKELLTEKLVGSIMIAPYSRILQWQFMRMLLRGTTHEEALSICPNGRFDLLVVPDRDVYTPVGYDVKTLRNYLEEHNLEFNTEMYQELKANP